MNTSKRKYIQGLTLTELLVVLAIIGILASVTMASLSGARTNARDKSIQVSMQGILVEAALFKTRHSNSYVNTATFCGDAGITALLNKINTENGGNPAPTCTVTSANIFAVRAQLNSGSWYCVDSSSFFGFDTGAFSGGLCRQ